MKDSIESLEIQSNEKYVRSSKYTPVQSEILNLNEKSTPALSENQSSLTNI